MLKFIKNLFAYLILTIPVVQVYALDVTAPAAPPNDWLSYAKFIYPFAISVGAILGVIMLIIAGLQMMTASESMRSAAKEKIQNVVIGLLLLLGVYLILNTINPALLNLKIDTSSLHVDVVGQSINPVNQSSSQPLSSNCDIASGNVVCANKCPPTTPAGYSSCGFDNNLNKCICTPAQSDNCSFVGAMRVCKGQCSSTPSGFSSCTYRADLNTCSCISGKPSTPPPPPVQSPTGLKCTLKNNLNGAITQGPVLPNCQVGVNCNAPPNQTASCAP